MNHDAMSRSGQDGSRKSWRAEKTWVPYHAVCPVCQNNFTVLKLDAEKWVVILYLLDVADIGLCIFSNEMQFFIQQQKLPIKSSAKVHAKGGVRNSMAKADKYFSELSPEQVSLSCDNDIFSSLSCSGQ